MFSTTTVLSVAIVLLDQVWCLGLGKAKQYTGIGDYRRTVPITS
jgi:hypothetical protein